MATTPAWQLRIKSLVKVALPNEKFVTVNVIKRNFPEFKSSSRSSWYDVALKSIDMICGRSRSFDSTRLDSTPQLNLESKAELLLITYQDAEVAKVVEVVEQKLEEIKIEKNDNVKEQDVSHIKLSAIESPISVSQDNERHDNQDDNPYDYYHQLIPVPTDHPDVRKDFAKLLANTEDNFKKFFRKHNFEYERLFDGGVKNPKNCVSISGSERAYLFRLEKTKFEVHLFAGDRCVVADEYHAKYKFVFDNGHESQIYDASNQPIHMVLEEYFFSDKYKNVVEKIKIARRHRITTITNNFDRKYRNYASQQSLKRKLA